jgi:hypothetical protein
VINSHAKTAKFSRTLRPCFFLRHGGANDSRYSTAKRHNPLQAGEVRKVLEGYPEVNVPRVWVRLGTPPFRGVPSVPGCTDGLLNVTVPSITDTIRMNIATSTRAYAREGGANGNG